MKGLIAGCLVALCSGCVSVSDVLPVGKDTYTVSAGKGGQLPSLSEVKGLARKRANDYCVEKGRYMVEEGWQTHGAPAWAWMWTRLNTELTFQCLADSTDGKK